MGRNRSWDNSENTEVCPEEQDIHAKYYLLGVYSEKPIRSIKIQGKKLKTHRIKCDVSPTDIKSKKVAERVQDKGSYLLVTHENYGITWNAEQEEIYTRDGVKVVKGA